MKLTNSLNVKQLIETEWFEQFDSMQQKHIEEGLLQGLQVELYADPRFTAAQMQEIRRGLMSKVDVSVYANSDFSDDQMEEIRRGLESGIDVSKYSFPYLASPVMRQKRE